jgi:DNA polymerase-1
MSKRLLLIDGYSLLFRAFFAMRALTNSKGEPTNALFGLTNMLITLIERDKPDVMICAWDAHAATFRHDAYPDYKGHRQETPDDLKLQAPMARQLVLAFGITPLEIPGFEADDIIGTLAVRGQQQGYEVMIVTGDSDNLQLVRDGISVMITVKGVTETVIYDHDKVVERYGLTPAQLVDYRALKGDSSDNIPNVPGVGEKTATALLQKYGTVENVMANVDNIDKPKIRESIREHLHQIPLARMLAEIRKDVPLGYDLPDVETLGTFVLQTEALVAYLERLEFRTLLKRVPGAKIASTPTLSSGASTVSDSQPTADYSAVPDGSEDDNSAAAAPRDVTITDDISILASWAGKPVAVRVAAGPGASLDAPIYGICIADGSGTALRITAPLEEVVDTGLFGGSTAAAVIDPNVKAFLEDVNQPKCVHDARGTLVQLTRLGIHLGGLAFDAELASYLLQAGRRSGYAVHDVAAFFGGIQLERAPDAKELKDVGTAERMEIALRNAALAADAIAALQPTMDEKLKAAEQTDLMQTMELPLAPILAEMECMGICLDKDEMKRQAAVMGIRISELEGEIHALAGEKFSIASPKQLQHILFEKMGVPSGKKTKTGFSTDADVLEELAPNYPIVASILSYRELTKLKSTYADSLPEQVRADGRIHTTLHQTVAATGRLSSSNPNLQNIPIRTEVGRALRKAFVAPAGKVLLSADYSQIELRIFAHVAEDEELRAAFWSGEDIHVYTASKVYGVEPADVTKDMRRAAKTVNYAVLYGISDFALGRQLKMTSGEAKALKAGYFERFPAVRTWLDTTIAFAREHGYVQTLDGRRRWIPDINSRVFQFRQAAERAAANMPIQGSSADIMKRAMIDTAIMLKDSHLPATLLLQVHDELLFEVDAAAAQDLAGHVRSCMEGAAKLSVNLDVDVKTGLNWAETMPLDPGA